MADKKPIRAVFNDSNVATGLAEFQSGDTVGLTHGGLGVSLSIGSAGQVLKVNSGASALEFGNVEAIVNIDGATDLTSATLATTKNDHYLWGSFALTTGTANGNQTALASVQKSFSCTPGGRGGPWWAKVKFSLGDHDGTEFFWGLSEARFDTDSFHLDAVGSNKNRVGFVKAVHDNDAVTFAVSEGSNGTISTAFDTAQTADGDSKVLEYGMYYDGVGEIRFYANKGSVNFPGVLEGPMQHIHTYNTAADIPATAMYFGLMIENGVGTVGKSAQIEYMSIATTEGQSQGMP